ncbi:hypothetical protein CYFUS_005999 [Cystobacter fuscus]|uniref:ABC-three component systems C-terminal domain-containing protein n=1 Tax=Cystobacter fuscus TaxID=43 RepID=A0A250JAF0_9BACT|nr:ABC-three component system protein [Cystobacter fuscus]ATB40550.1 hypothetical protein CYFUS_005999 [Cystobacter fuscus]
MSEDQSFSAAPAMAGYIWQARQALLFLLKAESEETVELESHDDVIVSSPTGKILTAIQGKHSFKSGALNCHSLELWKTLRVWVSLAARNRISETTPLILCSTHTVDKELRCLTIKSKPAADLDLLQKQLDAVAAKKQNKALLPAFQAWLGMTQRRRVSLLKQSTIIEARPRLAEVDAEFEPILKRMGVSPNAINYFSERLIGWFELILASRLKSGGCKVTAQELQAKLIELHQAQLPSVLISTKSMAAHPTLEAERQTDPVYLRQMDLLGAEEEDLANAVAMFHRAQAERDDWLQMRIDSRSALESYDNDLKNKWGIVRLEIMRTKPAGGESMTKAGWSIYGECMKYHGSYNGLAIPVHVANGSYHMLANGSDAPPLVGWHPDYVNRLVRPGCKE